MILVSIANCDVESQIKKLEKDDLRQLVLKISKLNKITWADVHTSNRHGAGYEWVKTNGVSESIVNRLPKGYEKFMVFRYNGKKPILGYKCPKEVFHILHIDSNFTAYRH
jgi:hypothetical protein